MFTKFFSFWNCRKRASSEPEAKKQNFKEEKEKSNLVKKQIRKQLMNQEIEINLKIAEIDEEFEKNIKELKKLKEKTEEEMAPHDKLVMKIKSGKIKNLEKTKINLQENKAKIRSLYHSLDTYSSSLTMNQSRKTQIDIMKNVSNLSKFDEMKTSMIKLEKELKEIGLVSEIIEASVCENFSIFDEKKEIEELESLYKKTKIS